MRQRIDIHEWRERYDRAVRGLKADKQLSDANRKKILRFVWDLQAEGITLPRLVKYLYILPKLAKLFKKDFGKASVQALELNDSPCIPLTK